jgi:hypothetical protein
MTKAKLLIILLLLASPVLAAEHEYTLYHPNMPQPKIVEAIPPEPPQTQVGGGGGGFPVTTAVTVGPAPGAINVANGGFIGPVPGSTGQIISSALPLPTNGLIGWYPMNDGLSQLTDISGAGNNGTFCGSPPTWLTNNAGLSFNGSSNCVILPTIFNSTAKAIILYVQLNVGAAYNCPIAGNTAGTSVAWFLTYSQDAANFGLPATVPRMRSTEPASTGSDSLLSFAGTGMISWLMDTTATWDRFFLGALEPLGAYGLRFATSFNKQSAGNLQLGGSSNGRSSSACWFQGKVYYGLVYNRIPTDVEIGTINQFVSSAMTSEGVPPNYANTGSRPTTDEVAFIGDSITLGVGGATPFMTSMNVLGGGGTLDMQNQGIAGVTLTTLNSTYPLLGATLARPQALHNVAFVWGGTNGGGLIDYQHICAQAHAVGQKCLITTMIDRTALTSQKNTLDAALRSGWRAAGADGLADMAADPLMGADGANTGTCFQSDHIHGTSGCNLNHMAPIAQAAINRLYGNLDFSSATVYASAATAPTATTAGSEATNTITITFGATPANCQVGNTITVAGTTPAGYSGNWQILTRSATQVTYFSDTAGLGVITVQGTGVCPQQQDADVYSILNFGAGNFTLETCQGYTGQNIYLKNINGSSSTVVPFAAETIDGAATVTVASKATLVLQSILVSSSAGGCSWKQLQNN